MLIADRLSPQQNFGSYAEKYDRWYQTREGKAYDLFEKRAFLSLIDTVTAARAKNIPSATFQEVDAHLLPFADDTFAASAAITSLEFMTDPPKVIHEMVRCTRTRGGTIYLGFLNPIAEINRKRRMKKDSFYTKARFFEIEEIKQLLSPYGKVQTIVCAFPMSVKLGPRGIWVDRLGTKLKIKHGAFIATRVDL